MLELDGLTVRYGTGSNELTAVDRISLAIPKGGTLGMVGESGSGKSTVARAIVGLVPVSAGSIRLDGVQYDSEAARSTPEYRRRVQMVFQDPYSSLNPRMTIGALLSEVLALHRRRPRKDRAKEALRILGLVGLGSSALGRYPHQFSGGQRQRIAIARALAVQPELIIMDEVTSALDVSVQATILNLLKDLQSELGLSYLFISHDLSVVGVMSESVAVMYLGRVVETAPGSVLFSSPRHPYTRALLASVPRFGSTAPKAPLSGDLPDPRNPPSGCPFHTRCPIGPRALPERTICKESDPQEVAEDQPNRAACHFARTLAGSEPDPVPVRP